MTQNTIASNQSDNDTPIRIFLAEDHHVVRAAVAALLSKEPDLHVIGETADGSDLQQIIANYKPDLLLMDAQMPNHKPVQATKKLRAAFPNMNILILSAYDLPEYVVGLLKAGASGYVLKDDPSEMLLRAIRAVAGGEEWVSPQAAKILVESMRQRQEITSNNLTPRETEILELVARGYRNGEIAEKLVLSEQTVRNHVSNVFGKLGAETRVEIVLYAIAHDIVSTNTIKDKFSE